MKKISQEAQKALLEYNFPGNIRELISIVQRACNILSEGLWEIFRTRFI